MFADFVICFVIFCFEKYVILGSGTQFSETQEGITVKNRSHRIMWLLFMQRC